MLGIAVPEGALARDPDDASEIAERVGYPVVLKAQAAALAHKSDAGGVVLNIADDAALLRAWDDIAADVRKAQPDLVLDGMLVEAMAPPGLELVVGARREPKWGPILTVGLGGIWIEALHDIRILPADIDREGIIDELHKLKGAALLRGGRGTPRRRPRRRRRLCVAARRDHSRRCEGNGNRNQSVARLRQGRAGARCADARRIAPYPICDGSHSARIGNAIKITRRIRSVTMNGSTPAKIVEKLTSCTTLLMTKTFMPTGG